MPNRLLRQIYSEEQEERHEAFDELGDLSDTQALPVLRRGLTHWDRSLRNKCSRALIERIGCKAASKILPLFAEGQLFATTSVKLLLKSEDDSLIRYLKRVKTRKGDLGQAAGFLYRQTRYFAANRKE